MNSFDHTSGQHFKIDDAEIYCEMIGVENKPALLFLHGGLGNIEDFNGITSAFATKFRMIGIDCRGHGKSTLGSKELTYELVQNDIEIILKQIKIKNLSIVGFSNGGIVAYRLAAFTKLKIDKLITIGAPWCTRHTDHLVEAYSKLTPDIWKELCPLDFEIYHRLNPKSQFDELFKQAIRMALDTTAAGRPNESVQNISCQTFIVRGENDPIVSASDILELSTLVKNSHLLNIPMAGHEAFKDQQEILITHLKNFLS